MRGSIRAALISFPVVVAISLHAGGADTPPESPADTSLEGLLVLGKYTGLCGALDEMIRFQDELKMPGGDEFVARFWSVTAAKQGRSVEGMSDLCNQVFSAYGAVSEAAVAIDSEQPAP